MRPTQLAAILGASSPPVVQYFPRLQSLTSATESGNGTTGYGYTGSAGTQYSFTPRCFNASDSLPLGDGYLQWTNNDTGGTYAGVVGLDSANTSQAYTAFDFAVFRDATAYACFQAGVNVGGNMASGSNPAPQVGDMLRLRFSNTAALAEIKVAGSTWWDPFHLFSNAQSALMYPIANLGGTGNSVSALTLVKQNDYARWTANAVKLVYDGNSLSRGSGSNLGNYPVSGQMLGRAPCFGSGTTMSNVSADAQTIALRTANIADAAGAHDGTRQNVLVFWEGTNSINAGRTAAQAAADLTAYIAAARAAKTWAKIVVMGTIPREGWSAGSSQATIDDYNARLVAWDALIKANPATYGADAFVDLRQAGSPFAFTGYTQADFDAAMTVYGGNSEVYPNRIHLKNAGYRVVARYLGEVLKTFSL